MTSTSSWKTLFSDALHSSHDTADAGKRIAPMIGSLDGPSSLEGIVIYLLDEAIKNPAKIDTLLSVYISIAEALSDDFEEGGWKGKHAAIKALGIQLSEYTQSLNPVLKPIFVDLLDDNCRNIFSESDPDDVADAVQQMAQNRRIYIISAAVYGRARTMDAVMEDDPEYDMAITRIELSLGLENGVIQVEANHIAAALYILASGSCLASSWNHSKRKASIERIINALKSRIISEESFKLKLLFSNALLVLQSGEAGWSSQRLFSDTSCLWLF